jgi:hypothetical protein
MLCLEVYKYLYRYDSIVGPYRRHPIANGFISSDMFEYVQFSILLQGPIMWPAQSGSYFSHAKLLRMLQR